MDIPVWVLAVIAAVFAILVFSRLSCGKKLNQSTKECKEQKGSIALYDRQVKDLGRKLADAEKNIESLSNKCNSHEEFFNNSQSNLTLFPYLAGLVAELETRDIEQLAVKLDWGTDQQRAKKVASIREIRKEAEKKIEQAKEYPLALTTSR